MSQKQQLKKEIDRELEEYQRIKKWVQEANYFYTNIYFLLDVKIEFSEADYHEAQTLKMTPEQFVLATIAEKQSELEFEWELQHEEPCELCGLRDCLGDCDEDLFRCSNCGKWFCDGSCVREDYDYMR